MAAITSMQAAAQELRKLGVWECDVAKLDPASIQGMEEGELFDACVARLVRNPDHKYHDYPCALLVSTNIIQRTVARLLLCKAGFRVLEATHIREQHVIGRSAQSVNLILVDMTCAEIDFSACASFAKMQFKTATLIAVHGPRPSGCGPDLDPTCDEPQPAQSIQLGFDWFCRRPLNTFVPGLLSEVFLSGACRLQGISAKACANHPRICSLFGEVANRMVYEADARDALQAQTLPEMEEGLTTSKAMHQNLLSQRFYVDRVRAKEEQEAVRVEFKQVKRELEAAKQQIKAYESEITGYQASLAEKTDVAATAHAVLFARQRRRRARNQKQQQQLAVAGVPSGAWTALSPLSADGAVDWLATSGMTSMTSILPTPVAAQAAYVESHAPLPPREQPSSDGGSAYGQQPRARTAVPGVRVQAVSPHAVSEGHGVQQFLPPWGVNGSADALSASMQSQLRVAAYRSTLDASEVLAAHGVLAERLEQQLMAAEDVLSHQREAAATSPTPRRPAQRRRSDMALRRAPSTMSQRSTMSVRKRQSHGHARPPAPLRQDSGELEDLSSWLATSADPSAGGDAPPSRRSSLVQLPAPPMSLTAVVREMQLAAKEFEAQMRRVHAAAAAKGGGAAQEAQCVRDIRLRLHRLYRSPAGGGGTGAGILGESPFGGSLDSPATGTLEKSPDMRPQRPSATGGAPDASSKRPPSQGGGHRVGMLRDTSPPASRQTSRATSPPTTQLSREASRERDRVRAPPRDNREHDRDGPRAKMGTPATPPTIVRPPMATPTPSPPPAATSPPPRVETRDRGMQTQAATPLSPATRGGRQPKSPLAASYSSAGGGAGIPIEPDTLLAVHRDIIRLLMQCRMRSRAVMDCSDKLVTIGKRPDQLERFDYIHILEHDQRLLEAAYKQFAGESSAQRDQAKAVLKKNVMQSTFLNKGCQTGMLYDHPLLAPLADVDAVLQEYAQEEVCARCAEEVAEGAAAAKTPLPPGAVDSLTVTTFGVCTTRQQPAAPLPHRGRMRYAEQSHTPRERMVKRTRVRQQHEKERLLFTAVGPVDGETLGRTVFAHIPTAPLLPSV